MKHLFNECVPVTVQFYTSGQSKISNSLNTFVNKTSRGFISKTTLKMHKNKACKTKIKAHIVKIN